MKERRKIKRAQIIDDSGGRYSMLVYVTSGWIRHCKKLSIPFKAKKLVSRMH